MRYGIMRAAKDCSREVLSSKIDQKIFKRQREKSFFNYSVHISPRMV